MVWGKFAQPHGWSSLLADHPPWSIQATATISSTLSTSRSDSTMDRGEQSEPLDVHTPGARGVQIGNQNTQHNHFYTTMPRPVFPIVVGRPPSLADAFQPRNPVRAEVSKALAANVGILLTGPGGVGKTQLAASIYFGDAKGTGVPQVRVWVDGTDIRSLVSGYAAAGRMLRPDLMDKGLTEPDLAEIFLNWAASTDASWLVAIDNIMIGPREMLGWWPPPSRNGAALITTQRRDPGYRAEHRRAVELDVFHDEEALVYLKRRMHDVSLDDGLARRFASAMGSLPLALAQATAVIQVSGWRMERYLEEFHARYSRLIDLFPADVPADEYLRTVATTSSLAIQQVRDHDKTGTAVDVALVASCFAPSGAIELLFYQETIRYFIHQQSGGQRSIRDFFDQNSGGTQPSPSADELLQSIRMLHMFCLVAHETDVLGLRPRANEPSDLQLRTGVVRMHSLTQRAIREANEAGKVNAALEACVEALHSYWPNNPAALTLEWLLPSAKFVLEELEARNLDWLYVGDIHQLVIEYTQGLSNLGHDENASETARRHIAQAKPFLGNSDSYFTQQDFAQLNSIAALSQARLARDQAERLPEGLGSQAFLDLARQLGEFMPEGAVEIWRARFDAATWRFFEGRRTAALQHQFNLLPVIRANDPLGITYLGTTILHWYLRDLDGDHELAARIMPTLLELGNGLFADSAEITLIGFETLASALGHLGKFEPCQQLMGDVLALRTMQYGEDHRDTRAAAHNKEVWHLVARDRSDGRLLSTLRAFPHAPRLEQRPGTAVRPIRSALPPLF